MTGSRVWTQIFECPSESFSGWFREVERKTNHIVYDDAWQSLIRSMAVSGVVVDMDTSETVNLGLSPWIPSLFGTSPDFPTVGRSNCHRSLFSHMTNLTVKISGCSLAPTLPKTLRRYRPDRANETCTYLAYNEAATIFVRMASKGMNGKDVFTSTEWVHPHNGLDSSSSPHPLSSQDSRETVSRYLWSGKLNMR